MEPYILNRRTGVVHTRPTRERCNIDDCTHKIELSQEELETAWNIPTGELWHRHDARFCAYCTPDPHPLNLPK